MNQSVYVCEIRSIKRYNIIFFLYFQNVLRELEQKKPQLDELVHTAENLRADTNRQQLHGKGESINDRCYFYSVSDFKICN